MLAVCGAMMFTSCSNDETVGADKLGEYQANFEKVFGQVSPAQNFNTQKTVTIESSVTNASGNYTLKVYDGKPGKKGASLLGKFENLNAGAVSTVKVDVSKGAKSLYCVADDGTSRRLTTSSVPASGRVTAKFDATTGTTGETEVTDEPASVTIAFEDLGSEDDFDFNDAVIKVEYVTGTGVANITLMAVGAVLPLKLYYADATGQTSPLFDGQELHEVMGRSQKTIINTNWKTKNGIAGADNVEFVTTEIEVPEDFTIGEDGAPFILEVNGVEGQRQITASTEYGAIPQVLVVGKFHSDDEAKTFFFRWPKERVRLDAAFPGISSWMNDPTDLSFLGGGVKNNLYNGYDPTIEDEQPTTDTPEGLEAIDLGLPSGTKWANMNVGATAPEESGGYYAWGETEEKDYYDSSTYIHCDGSFGTCYDLGADIAGTQYDVAHVKWGGNWKMPTLEQIQELLDNTTSTWTTQNGVKGRLFTASNGNSIFLPAAGLFRRDVIDNPGLSEGGFYWSSAQYPDYSYYAYGLYFYSDIAGCYDRGGRESGHTVRPVVTPKKQEEQQRLVALTKADYHQWTASDASGEIVGDGSCVYIVGSSALINYGNPSVLANEYADLSDCVSLIVKVSSGAPCLIFNRPTDDSQHYIRIPNNGEQTAKYQTTENNEDGTVSYIINVPAIVADYGFCHLHSIRGANWQEATVESISVLRE